ncbi:MAG: CDP-diacylglycerol--glycerol-3-phosphate 3-phosphatidyltransferase [Treponema sp.]|jgi:CDP-diacylglycerol--glycerol-3-phosphate 3-phosphatidyltransferase|nr:CDP-diacylglycerol--glycerol-3-phosphate 3-phosphatidyltransferase [Treponema sp.]
MHIADTLTTVRLIFAPIFLILYLYMTQIEAIAVPLIMVLIVLLALVECTDFLDGFAARKLNQVSDFGKLFDPFADVILHITAFFCFVIKGFMPSILFILIVYREFGMLFLRMISIKKDIIIGARKGGKLKTFLYGCSVFFTLALDSALQSHAPLPEPLLRYGAIGLYILCTGAAYLSFWDYITHFTASFKRVKKVKKI